MSAFPWSEEIIFDPDDDRKVVPDSTKPPYRFICHLSIGMKGPGGSTIYREATGTLIGPGHVLTCAHALLSRENGKVLEASKIMVSPGRNSAHKKVLDWKPFGDVRVFSYRVPDQWRNSFDWQCDFALLRLSSDIGRKKFKILGDKPLYWWGAAGNTFAEPMPPSELQGKVVNVCGYPEDKCAAEPLKKGKPCLASKKGKAQFIAHDVVLDASPKIQPGRFFHKADVAEGQSGAPVWRYNDKKDMRHLAGVQSRQGKGIRADGTSEPINIAVLVTRKMIDTLQAWGWER
jgi:V8-like Glu-specific endopeptidase